MVFLLKFRQRNFATFATTFSSALHWFRRRNLRVITAKNHTTKDIGQAGEQLARRYLEEQGLLFVVANWRCKLGEIDLIMDDLYDGSRVFVEVRLRAPTGYGVGAETVAREKQRKLIRATQLYQQQENYWETIRFDVVSIRLAPDGVPSIEHIPHAFEAA